MAEVLDIQVLLRAKNEAMGAFAQAEGGLAGIAKAGSQAAIVIGIAMATPTVEARRKAGSRK